MDSKHVLPIQSESFVMLVKQLKKFKDQADIFEIWLDKMKVKGDLAVIQNYFKKPMIAKSSSLDLLKKGVKAGFSYVDIPHSLETDLEFGTLVKNKGAKIIRSYHNFENTPSHIELIDILKEMHSQGAELLKIATMVHTQEDTESLLGLLKLPRFKDMLVVTGMGEQSHEVRVKAPIYGSMFYYAPIQSHLSSASGQLTREQLENEWDLL